MASFLASQSISLYNLLQQRKTFSFFIPHCLLLILLSACGPGRYISKQSSQFILSDSNFTAAHVGISIYDPSSNKYLYEHQAEKYFIPASNTKLYTCYAAMKHLGDSLVGANIKFISDFVIVNGAADPTFLHPGFSSQPLFEMMKSKKTVWLATVGWETKPLGFGWSWDDYNSDYMAERSPFPMYGNVVNFSYAPSIQFSKDGKDHHYGKNALPVPFYFLDSTHEGGKYPIKDFLLKRDRFSNSFDLIEASKQFTSLDIPYVTNDGETASRLLQDTLQRNIIFTAELLDNTVLTPFYSQPTDSLLKPMMHRSDNFFAEQTLLMVSNKMTGVMNDAKIIDSLLKTDFKDLPQKPRWVDGSGLSRYNLFSPNDMVTVLNKMKNEFAWNRITTILATGNEGTLSNYYVNLKDRIFAKTGTLSNNIAISGFLITKQNKTLIFSVLVNNHMGNTTQIRRAVEKFLTAIAEKY
jgi:D-alanyl-D-alanine carboxypeptidase/D-alanyl-D-alanine-endopeptidase (penicillin-binding protein 4)